MWLLWGPPRSLSCVWLMSPSSVLKAPHVVVGVRMSLLIFQCVHGPHCVYSSICGGTPGLFPPLAIVGNAAVTSCVQISSQVLLSVPLGTDLGVELLGHKVTQCFFFFEELPVFYGGCSLFHSYQQCTGILVSPHSHQYLLFFVCARDEWLQELGPGGPVGVSGHSVQGC